MIQWAEVEEREDEKCASTSQIMLVHDDEAEKKSPASLYDCRIQQRVNQLHLILTLFP